MPFVLNENVLKEADRALRAGDEQKIAHEIRKMTEVLYNH